MGAAQDLYKRMLREIIVPVLRSEGFKGSGGSWELPDTDSWGLLGFQTSDSSTAQLSKLTINLQVIDRLAWEEARTTQSWLPVRPSANVGYGVDGWDSRIGHLMPERRDHWWQLWAEDNPMVVGNEVLLALQKWGIPALRTKLQERRRTS